MKTSGIFFLRSSPASVRSPRADGSLASGWMLLLGERNAQRGITTFCALWSGDAADAFFRHQSALRAGDCLSLDLERLHVRDGEICGHVARCEPAPQRWPARSEPTGDLARGMPPLSPSTPLGAAAA